MLSEINSFLQLTRFVAEHDDERKARAAAPEDIVAAAAVVERILDRVEPGWRASLNTPRSRWDRWDDHVHAAQRVRALLSREAELREKLGEDAPQLDANKLHYWIWDGARSLWHSGHYREAVAGAAIKLNAETQNKLGRTDISAVDLFVQAFSESPPNPGQPRLRLMQDQGGKTFSSLHRGVRAFAEGCYAAIRNPISHEPGELTEDQALEQLAAFSVLARWVDTSVLIRG